MSNHRIPRTTATTTFLAAIWLLGCDASPQRSAVGATGARLSLACVPANEVPEDAWVCPEARSIACEAQQDTTLFLSDDGDGCDGGAVLVDSGPFAPGEHTVVVEDGEGGELCSAQLTVDDNDSPELTPHTLNLWPPNHKFHTVSVGDCVTAVDACDGELQGEFMWASSDEPIDSIGDGHHAPDILLSDDCQRVQVRSERQGPKDGRVYKLGVRVVDAAGNTAEGECLVIVDHDQRGVTGVDSGESYRVEFDGSNGGPACDGRVDPPADDNPPSDDDPPADDNPPSDDDPPSDDGPPADGGDPPGDSVPLPGDDRAPV